MTHGGIENGDKELLERAARDHLSTPAWNVPKKVKVGDTIVIYVSGYGFFATARVKSQSKPRPDWKKRYGADLDSITLIDPPISLPDIRRHLPTFGWAQFPRSITTVPPETAEKIRVLIKRGRGTGFPDLDDDALTSKTIDQKRRRELGNQLGLREGTLIEDAYYRESPSRLKLIVPLHNKLSNEFRGWLENKHKVKATQEQQCVDIRFDLEGLTVLAELKICSDVGPTKSIREALGQLLEYNHYPGRKVSDEWLLILDCEPSELDRLYILTLRDKRSLPITIGWQSSEGFSFYPKWPVLNR